MGRTDKTGSRGRGPGAGKPGGRSGTDRAPGRSPATPPAPAPTPAPAPALPVIELPEVMTVRELAQALRTNPIEIIKTLMASGMIVSINQSIDYDTAALVAGDLGFETTPFTEEEPEPEEAEEETGVRTLWQRLLSQEPEAKLRPRPPVVTVLGHVDHGKTTLLDAIRQTNVVAGEYGGITQHIGAYQVERQGRKITFIDTPGHEAFTAMRARGAQVTDLAVLVVAADDGVMPQTREAIDHARAAGVTILVALNKMDLATSRPERVKQQLADVDLTVEDWGGEVICVPVSAKMKQGIDDLLENILLTTDVANLRSNPDRPAIGTVIEAELDRHRGPTATLLVQGGTLRVGDPLLIGSISGRVRAMLDHRGKIMDQAPPATPVLVTGLSDVPRAGELFEVLESEREARAIAEERAERRRQAAARPPLPRGMSLEEVFSRWQRGQASELNLILKSDVAGSMEPIVNSLERLSTDELQLKILHRNIGNVSENDVMLAAASDAIIIGFHVEVDEAARRMAAQEGVDIRLYTIIYKVIEDVEKALTGMLEPVYEQQVLGHAEVRAVFHIRRRGNVAGSYVTDGEVARNASVRILRDGQELFEGHLDSLRRFQEDVAEVRSGFECGISVAGFDDFQEGDVFEFYKMVRVS